jgi:hypothetical protein
MSGMIQDIEAHRETIRWAHREAHSGTEQRSLATAAKAARAGANTRITKTSHSRLVRLILHQPSHATRSMTLSSVPVVLLLLMHAGGAIA